MGSIFNYISDNLNRFKFLKWVQIIKTESEATKKSALYLLEKSSTAFEVIVTDDSGAKRKLTGSGGGGTIDQENINRIPSATYSELGITPESTIEEKQIAISNFLEGYENAGTDNLFFEILDNPEIAYNFDVTANWNLPSDYNQEPLPVTDAESLIMFLEQGIDGEYNQNSFQNVIVEDFKLVDGRLQANITTQGVSVSLALSALEVTEVKTIHIGDYTRLNLSHNSLTKFELNNKLPETCIQISLEENQLEEFIYNFELSPGFYGLFLSHNKLTEFVHNFELPINIYRIYLNHNLLTKFNYNYSIPSSLEILEISNNEISDWSLSEPWANIQNNSSFQVNTNSNITSSEGTNFKNILQSKGLTVYS